VLERLRSKVCINLIIWLKNIEGFMSPKNISKNWLLICLALLLSLKGGSFANEIDYSLAVKHGDSSVFKTPFEWKHTNMLATSFRYGSKGWKLVPDVGQYSAEKINLSFANEINDYSSYHRHRFGLDMLGKGVFQEEAPELLRFLSEGDSFASNRKIYLNYFASVEKVRTKFWADGSYGEEMEFCGTTDCRSHPSLEWTAGATFNLAGLRLTGYYSDRDNISFNSFSKRSGLLRSDLFGTYYPREGYRVTGSYDLNTGTRLGFSYGSGELVDSVDSAGKMMRNNFERSLWAVGVYHDVTSWLKIVAEYNRTQVDLEKNSGDGTDSITVGGVLSW
tara:strand:+ start:1394 stop:2395 length:1002 start_codon:yes stop_codon:yes gene_type:complete